MTKLTEDEYLRSKMTTWDHLCWYSWVPAITNVFVSMMLAAFEVSHQAQVVAMITFLTFFAATIGLRTVLGNKVLRRKNEYAHLYD